MLSGGKGIAVNVQLYHFCPEWMLANIRRQGLTIGRMLYLLDRVLKAIPGVQWLTVNPDWNQSWCEHSTLPYRRNEARLTVEIPLDAQGRLHVWMTFCEEHPNELWADLNSFGDPENWRIYRGRIEPEWITCVMHNPDTVWRLTDAIKKPPGV